MYLWILNLTLGEVFIWFPIYVASRCYLHPLFLADGSFVKAELFYHPSLNFLLKYIQRNHNLNEKSIETIHYALRVYPRIRFRLRPVRYCGSGGFVFFLYPLYRLLLNHTITLHQHVQHQSKQNKQHDEGRYTDSQLENLTVLQFCAKINLRHENYQVNEKSKV